MSQILDTVRGLSIRDRIASAPNWVRKIGMLLVIAFAFYLPYLNILPFWGDPNGADVMARGLQYATQDRVGTAAAEVMMRPVFWTPIATAASLSPVRSHSSLTRESRKTS